MGCILGVYRDRDNGEENGNYYCKERLSFLGEGFRVVSPRPVFWFA